MMAFDIHTNHLNWARKPELIIINKKEKRIYKIVDFVVPADHRIKLKECEKKDKYHDLARELKMLIDFYLSKSLFLFLKVDQTL